MVNRRLLHFMLHLAAHLLAFSCIFFCFRFPALVLLRSCIHGLHLDRNSGAAPYRVIGVVTRLSSRLEILLIESLSQQSPAVLAASVYCCSRYVLGSLDECLLRQSPVVLTVSVHCRSVRVRVFISEIPPITCRFDS